MNCKNASRLLSAFQDQELAPALEHEVVQHLKVCQACRAEWDGLQELAGRLRLLPPPAEDPFFPTRVMAGLPAGRSKKFSLLPAAAYVLLFLMISIGGFILQLSLDRSGGNGKTQAPTFSAVLLENQDLGLLAVHDKTLVLFER